MDEDMEPAWILFIDESYNERGSSAGIVLTYQTWLKIEQSICFCFPAPNNKVEYEALLVRLKLAKAVRAERLKARSNS